MSIKILQKVELHKPVLLAAWPGMGNVALGTINYLRRNLQAIKFAIIDTSSWYAPDDVLIEDGLASLPPAPQSIFYFRKDPDIIFLENDIQFTGKTGANFTELVLNFIKEFGVSRIFTGAAFPIPMNYRQPSDVFGVSNNKSGRDFLVKNSIRLMEEGTISGLNGLILGYAQRLNIEAFCLLSTMPIYATHFPNPRAWKTLVEVFERLLGVRISYEELNLLIDEIDHKMEQIEEKFKEIFGMKEESELGEERISERVIQKIERLFMEAKHNRAKAIELKKELDKWGLFEMYEDRFLDLFKRQ